MATTGTRACLQDCVQRTLLQRLAMLSATCNPRGSYVCLTDTRPASFTLWDTTVTAHSAAAAAAAATQLYCLCPSVAAAASACIHLATSSHQQTAVQRQTSLLPPHTQCKVGGAVEPLAADMAG